MIVGIWLVQESNAQSQIEFFNMVIYPKLKGNEMNGTYSECSQSSSDIRCGNGDGKVTHVYVSIRRFCDC